jgi:hypothetical protein
MTESAFSTTKGAEISERSTELVLPDTRPSESTESPHEREDRVSQSELSDHPTPEERRAAEHGRASEPGRAAEHGRASEPGRAAADPSSSAEASTTGSASVPPERRGLALPGDRGRRTRSSDEQRPSFWRRIALGRRSAKRDDRRAAAPEAEAPTTSNAGAAANTPAVARESSLRSRATPARTATPDPAGAQAAALESLEKRVVEPMLQALVSVESKLERSHTELVGRSDQVEQRLTQLWDIEEQLGTLGELQESLLQVSEQQRRLEATIASQNRTLRWLLGAVLGSLALAAFVVAAVAR